MVLMEFALTALEEVGILQLHSLHLLRELFDNWDPQFGQFLLAIERV